MFTAKVLKYSHFYCYTTNDINFIAVTVGQNNYPNFLQVENF